MLTAICINTKSKDRWKDLFEGESLEINDLKRVA